MLEMASVSFNRVRLEYYVNKGLKRAIWLQYLLKKPSRLFGTIMLGVNTALQIGSQSSREFYASVGLNPDITLVTQVFLVVIIAELAPLFAARRFAEHVVMLGIPIIYGTYRLLAPLITLIGWITRLFSRLVGSKEESLDVFLTRDELQKVLESHEEGVGEGDEFNLIVANIFTLKNKTASTIMTPLNQIEMIRSNMTVAELKQKMSSVSQSFIPLYHKLRSNIISIAISKDLVRLPDNKIVRDFSRPPWFISQGATLIQIIKDFRRNNQSVAVVLNTNGIAVGMVTLDVIFQEIFGTPRVFTKKTLERHPVIERTLPGNTKIEDFNTEYGVHLESQGEETLADLMVKVLEHPPSKGDFIVVGRLELSVEEVTLLGIKTIAVKTLET